MEEKSFENWDDFDLKTDLLRGIYADGFEKPSAIQKMAIPALMEGKDVIGQAQSGSGKTGAFATSILHRIDIDVNQSQALILAPTHELACQIATVIKAIGIMYDNLVVKTLIGGTPVAEDARSIREHPPHIIVGCTGRVFDLLNRQYLSLQHIKMFVLDEADEMLSSGFKEQIYNIYQYLPDEVQVAIFSATLPTETMQMTSKFMQSPITIKVKSEDLNLECIQQFYVSLSNDDTKYDMLKHLYENLSVSQSIVYANSVKRVDDLTRAMEADGFSVSCIHSNMPSEQRKRIMQSFRTGNSRVLISSDLTARGMDVQQVNTVINFDLPRCVHNYLHRIGRSGRWGRKGVAINFITRQDIYTLKTIEEHYKSTIKELPANFKF